MANRRFVIPDIHGCEQTFRRLLIEVIRLERDDEVFLLGDIIDRGPRSKEVIDLVLRLQEQGYSIRSVRGNHEDMLLKSCRDRNDFHLWMQNGGLATLKSFGVEDGCEIPEPYRAFIAAFPFYVKLHDFILVHASLNFRITDPFSDKEAMLWSRDTWINKNLIGGKKLIGGHTPVKMDQIRASLSSDRIMLDNGCVYITTVGLGSLTALELNSMALYTQENIEDT